ncbi:MAG: cyanophycin synthetase, partial [Bacteroidota bacterium]
FARFADNFRENAVLLVKNDVDLKINRKDIRIFNYSLDDGGDFYAQKIRIDGRRYCFDICVPDGEIRDISLPVPSLFNVENAVAASALAYLAGAKPDDIRSALETFSGIRRRFDMHCDGSIVYIDDYAHHPAEIAFCMKSVRKLYPGRKICAVFQPHLYSRTKDLAEGFAESLDLADQIILLDIYPARENPIPGVDAGIIFDKIRNTAKLMCPKEKLIDTIKAGKPDILVTMGAGDIDMLVEPIIKMLQELK